jgi:hypothetical protein
MCDDRERLIGYVYDECDGAERRAIEAHLEGCHDCRQEIGGLRHVRQDLLAWDVPSHESIWRPLAPPRPQVWWREVPAWAMAAAASAVFVAGAAGGVATRLMMPAAVSSAAVVGTTASAPSVPTVATADDLARAEARILTRVRAEMDQRIEAVAAHDVTPAAQVVRASDRSGQSVDALVRRVADMEQWRESQINLNIEFDKRMGKINNRTSTINQQLEASRMQGLQRVSLDMGGR